MKTRGAISLVFDDGHKEIISDVLPLLKKYNIKATIAVPVNTEKVEHSKDTTIAFLNEWKNICTENGHELAAHGINHVPLPSLSDENLSEELRVSYEETLSATLIYPGGAFNERVKNIAMRYFSSARTTMWGMENLQPKDNYALKTINATKNNFAVWKWNIMALRAIVENKWLIETYHRVNNNTDDLHNVRPEELEAHLKFISLLPIKIDTVGEIIKLSEKNR